MSNTNNIPPDDWHEKYAETVNALLTEHEMSSSQEGGCTARFRQLTSFEKFLIEKIKGYQQLKPK